MRVDQGLVVEAKDRVVKGCVVKVNANAYARVTDEGR
jgi:hypothetical protein